MNKVLKSSNIIHDVQSSLRRQRHDLKQILKNENSLPNDVVQKLNQIGSIILNNINALDLIEFDVTQKDLAALWYDGMSEAINTENNS